MKKFMDENFLLETATAQELYHNHAAKMPIIDYHCHLIPEMVATDHKFKSITELWLGGDHYKWRQMRSNGVDEYYITGGASDREKFQKWAETLEMAIGNPLCITGAIWNSRDISNTPVISAEKQQKKYGTSAMKNFSRTI